MSLISRKGLHVVCCRSFLHGDVCTLASDPQGQIGTVVDVSLHLDLKFPHQDRQFTHFTWRACIIRLVSSIPTQPPFIDCVVLVSDLSKVASHLVKPVHPFFPGKYVVKGAVLGVVDDVRSRSFHIICVFILNWCRDVAWRGVVR